MIDKEQKMHEETAENIKEAVEPEEQGLLSTNGQSLRTQMIGITGWLAQFGMFGLAMAFRYSGEYGGTLMEQMFRKEPVTWKPLILDWPGLPVTVAGLLIALWLLYRRRNPDTALADIGLTGSLTVVATFVLSGPATSAVLPSIIGIWLCALVSYAANQTTSKESYNIGAAALLIASCVLASFIAVQQLITSFEFVLLFFSLICGIASTGWQPTNRIFCHFALPAWSTLLLTTFYWADGPLFSPMRLLVLIELSAAFIAGHYLDLFLKNMIHISISEEAFSEAEEPPVQTSEAPPEDQ